MSVRAILVRTLILSALIGLSPRPARADGRLNIRFDFNHTDVGGADRDVGLSWQGIEVEL